MHRFSILGAFVAICLMVFGNAAHARTLTINQPVSTPWFTGTVSGTFDTVAKTGTFTVKGIANPNKTRVAAYTIDAQGTISANTDGTLYTVESAVTVTGKNGSEKDVITGQGNTFLTALAAYYKNLEAFVHTAIGLG